MSDIDSAPPIGSRPIPRAPGYRIVDGGTVWSNRPLNGRGESGPWHIVKPFADPRSGRLRVGLVIDGKQRRFFVHSLILEAFIGPCPEGLEACHNDGDRTNNLVENLRWDTRKNNHADRKFHGTDPAGERNPIAKLKERDIPEIFRLAKHGLSHTEIGARLKVSAPCIQAVLKRRHWKHVEVGTE